MKVLVVGVLVLFVGFWLVEAPGSLATVSRDVAVWLWDMTTLLFQATIDFFNALAR